MKPAVAVLCLLVTVTTVSAGQPPLEKTALSHEAPPRLREVRFEGNPAFEPEALKKVLKELRIRQLIPGIWTRRPLYDARAVEADLIRLRSFYFSRGYFDARVGVGAVTTERGDAILKLAVQSGPRYAVRRVEVDGIASEHAVTRIHSGGEFPVDRLCACLLDAKRNAESRGRIDVALELEVSPADGAALPDGGSPLADVTARVRPGPAYAVGRIDFSGHHRINEDTLRRAMTLQERSLFDVGKLRTSLARLNRFGLFEPLTLSDVGIERNPATGTADLTIAIRERSGRNWSLSGPLGPSALGVLEANISSRLPPWGRGLFEASTYSLTFSLTGFSNPLIRLLPIPVKPGPRALLVLERPYLPGQALASGFALSPQLSARRLLAGYGLTHLDRVAESALAGEPAESSGLLIPIAAGPASGEGGESDQARFLLCNPPAPSHQRLRRAAALATDLTLAAFRPF